MRQALVPALSLLVLLAACGGGSAPVTRKDPPPQAGTLGYRDPVGTGWRLVRNASLSAGRHLVLDLLPPADVSGRGAALMLEADPACVAFSKVSSMDPDLVGAGTALPAETGLPVRLGVASQGRLRAAWFAKGRAATAYQGRTLLRIALDLAPGVEVGTLLPLQVREAQGLVAAGGTEDLLSRIAVGTLVAEL